MTTVNDVFDKVVCLTLDRREERWQQTLQRCKREGINVEKFIGIDGKELEVIQEFEQFRAYVDSGRHWSIISRPGQYAIVKSYIKLFELLLKEKHKKILLLQDDVTFHKYFQQMFDDLSFRLPKWDMWYLGATRYNIEPPKNGTMRIERAQNCDGLFAVAVNGEFIPRILDVLYSMYYPADSSINFVLQPFSGNIIVTTSPPLCGHDYGYSDNYDIDFTKELVETQKGHRYYDPEIYY